MNKLKSDMQKMILNLLVEGNSIRGIERITGVHRDTIMRLMLRIGDNCQKFMKNKFQNLNCNYVECDEIWTYVQKKQARLKPKEKNGDMGDQYVFVALDRDTKIVPVFMVAKRTTASTCEFLTELRKRIVNTPQITTDQFSGYKTAVPYAFGKQVKYATLCKAYVGNKDGREGYSPPRLRKIYIKEHIGKPDLSKVCTSYVERQNLTMRTQIKRFTRLTNAFSKKLENLKAALAIHFWHYNFMRNHRTLKMTPAMASGIEASPLSWSLILT